MEAPGSRLLVMLPGPPRELRPMFRDQVMPLLLQRFPLAVEFYCRTLKTTGLGESLVEQRLAPALAALVETGLGIGYCARVGEVDVRFTASGAAARSSVSEAERIAREKLGSLVFGIDDESLEAIVVRLLRDRVERLALAESCTGGFIAHRITNVPGASLVFTGGFVTYSNEAKAACLGVRAGTLDAHGAVSEATVREMAEGARARLQTDYAIAVTGIAGPDGGSADKPVGTVWIGLATKRGTAAVKKFNPVDRETFKYVTSQQALEMLRREMLEPTARG